MNSVPNANSITLRNRKPLAPPFHRHIAKKEISVARDECHSKHSILDFRHLGFDPKKTHNLMMLNIKGLVTKYETFYFPQMLRP